MIMDLTKKKLANFRGFSRLLADLSIILGGAI